MFKQVVLPTLTPRDELREETDKRLLLSALVDKGSLKMALACCNVSLDTARKWRLEDEQYNREFEIALKDGTRLALETAGLERALHSSDNLLMFFLKALDRETYDDAVARTKVEKQSLTIRLIDEKKA